MDGKILLKFIDVLKELFHDNKAVLYVLENCNDWQIHHIAFECFWAGKKALKDEFKNLMDDKKWDWEK